LTSELSIQHCSCILSVFAAGIDGDSGARRGELSHTKRTEIRCCRQAFGMKMQDSPDCLQVVTGMPLHLARSLASTQEFGINTVSIMELSRKHSTAGRGGTKGWHSLVCNGQQDSAVT